MAISLLYTFVLYNTATQQGKRGVCLYETGLFHAEYGIQLHLSW